MSTWSRRQLRLVRDYSKALEQVSLIGDAVHNRIRDIQRIIAKVQESPDAIIAGTDGFHVPSTADGVINDNVLLVDNVSMATLHWELMEWAKAKGEKVRIEKCLRNTEYANLIKE